MEYIWFDDIKPIKKQLPKEFKSAAIILNPFTKMPKEWLDTVQKDTYPSEDEILKYGESVKWSEILKQVEFDSYEELEIALKSSIRALNDNYIRLDLEQELESKISENVFYPCEDIISEFIIKDFRQYILNNHGKKMLYRTLIDKNILSIDINKKSIAEICETYHGDVIILDEKMEYALMSIFDSFFTVLLCRNEEIEKIIDEMKWEAIICNEETPLTWYLKS